MGSELGELRMTTFGAGMVLRGMIRFICGAGIVSRMVAKLIININNNNWMIAGGGGGGGGRRRIRKNENEYEILIINAMKKMEIDRNEYIKLKHLIINMCQKRIDIMIDCLRGIDMKE